MLRGLPSVRRLRAYSLRESFPADNRAPFAGLGGYYLSVISNTAFPTPKILQISWAGVRFAINPDWDITGATYH